MSHSFKEFLVLQEILDEAWSTIEEAVRHWRQGHDSTLLYDPHASTVGGQHTQEPVRSPHGSAISHGTLVMDDITAATFNQILRNPSKKESYAALVDSVIAPGRPKKEEELRLRGFRRPSYERIRDQIVARNPDAKKGFQQIEQQRQSAAKEAAANGGVASRKTLVKLAQDAVMTIRKALEAPVRRRINPSHHPDLVEIDD